MVVSCLSTNMAVLWSKKCNCTIIKPCGKCSELNSILNLFYRQTFSLYCYMTYIKLAICALNNVEYGKP